MGDMDVVRLLVENGADATAIMKLHYTALTAAEFRQELFVEYSGQQLWRPPFLRLLLAPSLRLPLGQRTNCARACLFFCPRIDTDKAQVGGNPEDEMKV